MSDTNSATSNSTVNKNDGFIATVILVLSLILIGIMMYFLWKNKKILGIADSTWKTSTFTPPPERDHYIVAKQRLDPSNPNHLDELKKLLMRRAIQSIPLLLNLQNEGNSIERLYKRGMLTDDMHFKVKELKTFVDQEFQDVQLEAEDLVEGWGQNIWPQAMQFHQMIQKQAEEKEEDKSGHAEDKNKKPVAVVAADKKKDSKEKAKKTPKSGDTNGTSGVPVRETEALRAQEAERMAKLLLEEEERERNMKKKSAKK